MSRRLLESVLNDSKSRGSARHVLIEIANLTKETRSNFDPWYEVAYLYLAKRTGYSEKTVRLAVKELQKIGELRKGKGGRFNAYKVVPQVRQTQTVKMTDITTYNNRYKDIGITSNKPNTNTAIDSSDGQNDRRSLIAIRREYT